ncbi:pirin family protein [Mangrovimicrobium sediminis]|uniref:Pirin family protein n=1 Tax=Mangrovimicrobium sediminis TaxID=2562682 RepID=A0A4Z0M103_9GAMM|nr:pirin family protein [Haliea sp. SAOS-164]TGD73363.1 pirin family protein [Haliea sp. SAOS-164]
MSFFESGDAPCDERQGSIRLRIEPKLADLGEFSVRRALPAKERRMVGPFVFFDHMGPAEFPPGKGIAVRPHPHIGIATITYLFRGEIMHRDSLGVEQPIRPGAVNLMVAGSGIVHSERAGSDLDTTSHLHGIQSWIALPVAQEEIDAAFTHYAAGDLPELSLAGARVRIIMGEAYGESSPVQTFSRTLYLDIEMQAGAELALPEGEAELAFYVVEGSVEVDAETVQAGVMAIACPEQRVQLRALESSRVMVIGGDNIGPRQLFWNFVSSRPERIEQAKQDWRDKRFAMVPGDDEFIPLPE